MFSQACVKNSVRGGSTRLGQTRQTPPPGRQAPPFWQADVPWQADTPRADTPLADRHPPPADGYCSGRYASYWNAFLLLMQGRGAASTDITT